MNVLVINCSPVRHGATAEISMSISAYLKAKYTVKNICIDDYSFDFCTGCRSCHKTAMCMNQDDDIVNIMNEFEWADTIISISPSYWADIPGQFKSFIDRCTPWCNTHEPHATISQGKKGYCIALRTGPNMGECNRIIETINHFYAHLEISPSGSLGLCSVEDKKDVYGKMTEIEDFCKMI